MKETGPEAVPPPDSCSLDDRRTDRLVPVPLPNLNSMPSVLTRSRIDSIESCTELMKHAEPCCERVDDPIDDLADACFALGGVGTAAEILLGDDVDRQLGPRAGDLDILLLEDDLAFLAGDPGSAPLPLNQVEGMAARRREEAFEAEPRHFP